MNEPQQCIYGTGPGAPCAVAGCVVETGRPAVTRSSDSQGAAPSAAYSGTPGSIVAGKVAEEPAGVHPERVVSLIGRQMGGERHREFSEGAHAAVHHGAGRRPAAVAPAGSREAAVTGTAPALVVKTGSSARVLPAGAPYRVGRDPQSDIVVEDSRVSWRHAVLRAGRGGWVFEDVASTNGTFLGACPIGRFTITRDCVLRLGHPEDGPVMTCEVVSARRGGAVAGNTRADRRPAAVTRTPARVVRIGRAGDNDLVVADLSVSRYHAELHDGGDGRYGVVDLDSHNGTFVNGRQVSRSPVTGQDLIGIGRASFRLAGGELRESAGEGGASLVARDLTVRLPGGKVLLDHVSFPVPERSLVGVIGPSGAGKSTLLGALTGMRPAGGGTVLYDNRDLYAHYAELRHRIGFVPQDNLLHTQLSARRALGYAAELRFPGDTSAAERDQRVTEVIGELGLGGHADTRAGSLSGGQQKRVNVALELLTRPSLLFLDEPTSGLDPGLDKSVMEMMSGLARDGRTVVVVTHSMANLDICDRLLVLVPGGRVAYYGPPAEGLRHFGQPGWAEVFQAFDNEPDRDWAGEFAGSPYHARYVAGGLAAGVPAEARGRPAPPPPAPRSRLAQLSTLCRRYAAVIASDRNFMIMLSVLPVVLGLLIRAVGSASPRGLAGPGNVHASSVMQTLIICACFLGVANSVRELVKERAIYSRERAAGLSSGAYLLSKVIVLGLITGAQTAVLVTLGLYGMKMPPHGAVLKSAPLPELVLAMAVLAVASMALGLLASAMVSTSEKTMPVLVLATIAQVILCGGLLALPAGLNQLSYVIPARWGFAAAASTVNFHEIIPPGIFKPESIWDQKPATWLTDMGLQALIGAVCLLIACRRLIQLSPGPKRRWAGLRRCGWWARVKPHVRLALQYPPESGQEWRCRLRTRRPGMHGGPGPEVHTADFGESLGGQLQHAPAAPSLEAGRAAAPAARRRHQPGPVPGPAA